MAVFFGAPAEIRTPDTLLKRQVLCRLSYWVRLCFVLPPKAACQITTQRSGRDLERRCGGMSELWPPGKARDMQLAPTMWQGWLDSNQRVRESKSLALPLGYTPVSGGPDKRRVGADAPTLPP